MKGAGTDTEKDLERWRTQDKSIEEDNVRECQ